MADQISGEKLSAQVVANAFVQQYYQFLKDHPEYVHKFYNDSSVVNWPGPDGSMKSATNTKEINEIIMSSDHNDYIIQIIHADAQGTLTEGLLVVVTGVYISKENQRKAFSQTFVLARQEKAIFVVNDILRFVDVHESSTNPTSDDVEGKASDVPSTQDSENAPDQPLENCASTHSEAANDTIKKVENQSNIKGVADEEVVTKPLVVSPLQSKPSVNNAASSVKDDNNHKITYASMLARESPIISPTHGTTRKISRAAGNANESSGPALAPKTSASQSDNTPKTQVAATSNGVPNVSRPPSNGEVESNNVHQAAKGLYLRGLPIDVTKNGILDVFIKFGRVKLEDIQVKRYEDGFCCGFVEFQSADSARNAVLAGKVEIGGKEVHISYKKRSSAKGSNGSGRYPPGRGGARDGNFRGQQDGERSRNESRHQFENQPDHRRNTQNRDAGQGWFSNGRNGDGAYRRNSQKRDDRVAS